MPFPGLSIDNLPFFAVIAAIAEGQTLVHDWVYENRAIYLTELAKLGADVKLLDRHRLSIQGPTRWRAAELMCPPALRPAVVILLAMLATEGTSGAAPTYDAVRAGRAAQLDRRTRRTVLRWHGHLTDSAPSTYSRPRTVTRRYACRTPSNDS